MLVVYYIYKLLNSFCILQERKISKHKYTITEINTQYNKLNDLVLRLMDLENKTNFIPGSSCYEQYFTG